MTAARDGDVAVVGVGTVGSMALWRLAERGVDAVGFEQFAPGHDRGAAGGESRVFRTAYHEGAAYVPLLLEALDGWQNLGRWAGVPLLDQCGYLEVGPVGDPGIAATLAVASAQGLEHTVFSSRDAAAWFPEHRFGPDDVAVLDPAGGVLRPEHAVVSAARRAEAGGARLLRRTPVEALEADGDGVTLHAAGRHWRFGSVVVATGAWAGRLLPEVAGAVRPTRLPLAWFPAVDPTGFTGDRFPAFGRTVEGSFIYGIPTIDGRSVKVTTAAIDDDVPVDPDRLDHQVPWEVLDRIADLVARHLPGLVPDPVRSAAYVDGYTLDGHGLVGVHPDHPRIVVVAGLSGHGFKLAPALGAAAADLAVAGRTDLPVSFLDPGRFRSGVPR